MLRAIGMSQKQVRNLVIAESLLLAAIGTAFGLIAGLYLGYVMVLGLSSSGYPVTYVFPYAGLIAATAVGLLFGVLAAIFPVEQTQCPANRRIHAFVTGYPFSRNIKGRAVVD